MQARSTDRVRMSRTRVIAVLLALALVAVACSSSSKKSSAPAGSDVKLDPNGVLKVATTLVNFGFDQPTSYASPVQLGISYHFIGTPLQLLPDGTFGPYLAESYKIPDPQTLVLTLRKGITFQDGAPYDAATLKAAFLANRATGNAIYDVRITNAVSDISVDSPTQLTFKLSSPIAGQLPAELSAAASYATRPGPNGLPIGAGPYKLTQFVANNKLVLQKWDGFYDAASYKLAEIDYLNIPDIAAAQNALQSGQVDLIATNPSDVAALLTRGSFAKVVTNNQSHYMLAVCKSAPPFDNLKFRQAFDLAIDRTQLNEVVLGGNAKPMTSVWDPSSAYALPLVSPTANQQKAKDLLASIGWNSSTKIPFGYFNGFQTHQLIAETLQGQMAKVGINLDIKPIVGAGIADIVGPKTGGGYVIANSNPGVQKIVIPALTPGSTWDPCDYTDPTLQNLANEITGGGTATAPLKDVWQQAEKFIVDNEVFYPLLTQPSVYVYNTNRVVGLKAGTVGLLGATAPSPFLAGVGIKAG